MRLNILVCILFSSLIFGVNLMAGNSGFQKGGNYVNLKNYPPYQVSVNSSSVFISSAVPYGVERIFKINGVPSGTLFFQRGGATSTIVSAGLPLSETVYYVEDAYFGDIYFETDTATADLRISTLRRE
jgi:hypothetical protein